MFYICMYVYLATLCIVVCKANWFETLVGSIGVTCRSQIAKIFRYGNPRNLARQPSWKYFCVSSPELKKKKKNKNKKTN